jgi:mannose-6-phosphate isomerase
MRQSTNQPVFKRTDPTFMTAPSLIPLAPFRIDPKFDTRVWGSRDLRPWFDRVVPPGDDPIGEAWLTGDMCLVSTGPHAGKRLDALFAELPASLLGPAAPVAQSPILIKVLFPNDKLSVQVHPDDKMAQKYGDPRGKTECWYALAAQPGAEVAVGLKPGVTLAQVEHEIHDGTLEASLNMLPISAGDLVFVDAGTVHAIWPGSVLLETQQNCDLTYRMFDYGRPRELHIEKSLEATKLVTRAGKVEPVVQPDRTVLIDAEYFRVERIPVSASRSSLSLVNPARPAAGLAYLFAAAGAGRISGPAFDSVDLPASAIVCIPAAAPPFTVENLGSLDLIRITPNWPAAASGSAQ